MPKQTWFFPTSLWGFCFLACIPPVARPVRRVRVPSANNNYTDLTPLISQLLISHNSSHNYSSHTTHLTHYSSHTTHLTHNSSHTQLISQLLISHNSSHTQLISHTTHLTHNSSQTHTHTHITKRVSYTTHLTHLISYITSHTTHLTHTHITKLISSYTSHLTSYTTHPTHNSSYTQLISQTVRGRRSTQSCLKKVWRG